MKGKIVLRLFFLLFPYALPFEDKSGIIKYPFLVLGSVVTDKGKNMEFNDWRSHIIGTQLFIQPGYRRVFAAAWGEFHLYFSAVLLPFIASELGFVFACTKIKVERAMRTDCFFRKKID